jgi:hypothetical protein
MALSEKGEIGFDLLSGEPISVDARSDSLGLAIIYGDTLIDTLTSMLVWTGPLNKGEKSCKNCAKLVRMLNLQSATNVGCIVRDPPP